MATPRIGMVAGEASGDLLAASVLACWRGQGASSATPSASQPGGRAVSSREEGAGAHSPSSGTDRAVCAGIGGPRMQAEGFEAWWPSEWLAVHG